MGRNGSHRQASTVLLVASLTLVVPQLASSQSTLVLHLPFDDGSGFDIAADTSGNGLDGTLVNMDTTTDWVSGMAGLALDFDGSNDYVSVPDDAALDFGTGDFSVLVWVYKHSTTTNFDNTYAVSKWVSGANPGSNEWGLLVGSGQGGDNAVFVVETGDDRYGMASLQELTLNEWHQIVGVRQAETLSLYVDGTLAGRDSSLPPLSAINNVGRHLRVAVNQPGHVIFYTDGLFDDVQIYNFALDDGGVDVGQAAGGDIEFLYANPGVTLQIFKDGFEFGDTFAWTMTIP